MSPALFVYNSTIPCADIRHGKDMFELKLRQLLETEGFIRTRDAREAEIFYHPACLVDAFFRFRPTGWWRNDIRQLTRTAESKQIERAVLSDIRMLGYGHKPHIVNALRCFSEKPMAGEHAATNAVFPVLWGSRRFLRFCSEAVGGAINQDRSIHMPYCPASPAPNLLTNQARPIRILFLGSNVTKGAAYSRRAVLDALQRTNGSVLLLRSRAHGINASSLDVMRQAVYTLCPEGDTPDSERIYHALSRGSVPVLNSAFQPPGFADWSKFSVRIRVDPGTGALVLPTGVHQAALQYNAQMNARTFECELDNPYFRRYVALSVMRLATHAAVTTARREARKHHN
eukprot:6214675-Pleurochrysis_carterae.AAC.3